MNNSVSIFNHLAAFASGTFIGAAITVMIFADGAGKMADAMDELTRTLREDMVILPVSKPRVKP